MTSLAKRGATYADVLALPDNVTGEVVFGDLLVSHLRSGAQAVAASAIAFALGPPFVNGRGGPGDWWIIGQPELHLGENVLVADLSGWLRTNLPSPPQDQRFIVPPRWICEVISPSTGRYDRTAKLDAYLREGVAWAWIVDPLERTLEIYRAEAAGWLRVQAIGAEVREARIAPFETVAIDVSTFWIPEGP